MPDYLSLSNMPNYSIGYTENLYNQPQALPAFPSLFNNFSQPSSCSNIFSDSCMDENPMKKMMNFIIMSKIMAKQNEVYNQIKEEYDQYMKKVNSVPSESPVEDKNDDEQEPDKKQHYNVAKLKEKWGEYDLSDSFYKKVLKISKRIKCNPNALMAVMKSESGFDPKAVNSDGGATGLIQFMPKTASWLGTSTDELSDMSREEQLKYVEKYLVACKQSAKMDSDDKVDNGTLYALVYLPGRAKRNVLATEGESYYEKNKRVLDVDKDGDIDKSDLSRQVKKMMG